MDTRGNNKVTKQLKMIRNIAKKETAKQMSDASGSVHKANGVCPLSFFARTSQPLPTAIVSQKGLVTKACDLSDLSSETSYLMLSLQIFTSKPAP